jgi:hypothetical protein
VMQDVSDKLLGQFVSCLEQRLVAPEAAETPEAPSAPVAQAAPEVPAAPAAAAVAQPAPGPSSPREPEALDLGSAVLPVLARTYWRPALAGLVLVVLLWRLLRRR